MHLSCTYTPRRSTSTYIGTRPDLLYQRDYFSAVIEMAQRARKEGRSRDELAKVEVLPGFQHFGGTKSRLGLALMIAYGELGKGSGE